MPDSPSAKENPKNGWAIRGILQAQLNLSDPTKGATHWDGTDFLAWGLNNPQGRPHAKFREYKKITIPKAIYDAYLSANLNKYPSGKVSYGGKSFALPAKVYLDKNNWITGSFVYSTGAKSAQSLLATVTASNSHFWAYNFLAGNQ